VLERVHQENGKPFVGADQRRARPVEDRGRPVKLSLEDYSIRASYTASHGGRAVAEEKNSRSKVELPATSRVARGDERRITQGATQPRRATPSSHR